jgi:hypothetical protein
VYTPASGRLSAGSGTACSGVFTLTHLLRSSASRCARFALGAAGVPGGAVSPTGVCGALRRHQAVNRARGAHAGLPLLLFHPPCAMVEPAAQVLAISNQLYWTDEPGWQVCTWCFPRSHCASSRARRARAAASRSGTGARCSPSPSAARRYGARATSWRTCSRPCSSLAATPSQSVLCLLRLFFG